MTSRRGFAPTGIALLAAMLLPALLGAQTAAPRVRPEWREGIRANHAPLLSLDAASPAVDLAFLGRVLAGKRLVALGESGHGVSEFSRAKLRLVKFLHEALGYDVIAFESSLYECFAADREAALRSPEETLAASLFGVWQCREVLDLIAYIKSTKATARPLVLAGFDIQISSARGVEGRPAAFRQAVSLLDPAYAATVEREDALFLRHCHDPAWIAARGARFKAFYANLAWWLRSNLKALAAARRGSTGEALALLHTARSMGAFIDELAASGAARTNARDKGMADNVAALADEIYPGRKIILWGHNLHFQRDAREAQGGDSLRTMGWWLSRTRPGDVYAIGLFCGRGRASWNDRTAYALSPLRDDSLEAVLMSAGRPSLFVDLAGAARNLANGWIWTRVPAKDWGFFDVALTPGARFDAILFIRDVTPPAYLVPESEEDLPYGDDLTYPDGSMFSR